MTDLFLGNGCAAHDCQNARKCLLASVMNAELLSDVHIIMESLRNSSAFLFRHLPGFLVSKLQFRTEPQQRESV
eukprot:8689694-Lingulodinium_polyedra.AAC.1